MAIDARYDTAMRIRQFLALGALLWITAGCATQTPGHNDSSAPPLTYTASAQASATTRPDMETRPFMFDEASLPQGYPAPSPVGQVLIKHYPAARVAINRGDDQDSMFMPLFNHIKKNDIAMSSPVEITWSDPQTQADNTKPQAMAFVYRAPDIGAPGTDGNVEVMDVPPQTFLSIGVRGSYNRQHLVEGIKALRDWLAAHSNEYKESGPPRYLGYNSPFVPWFLRFGEVQLPISPVQIQP